jgi:putative oxidoreductase
MDMPGFAKTLPSRGIPEVLGYVSPFVEFIAGVLLVLGLATRYAAIVAFLFMIVATFSSHRYWSYPAAQQGNQEAHFWKNIAMMGGNLLLFVTGAGRYSLDRMLSRK